MKAKPLAALALLLLLVLGAAVIFAVTSLGRTERDRGLDESARLERLLEPLASACRATRSGWEASLREAAAGKVDTDRLRALSSGHPLIRQAFLLDREGRLSYPLANEASLAEAEFLKRAATFLEGSWLPPRPERGDWAPGGGWFRWFWRDGLQLMYWIPLKDGFLCMDLNRSALLGELAGALSPPGLDAAEATHNRIRLNDEQGKTFLQWGSWNGDELSYRATLDLDPPFDGWSLSWDLDPERANGDGRSRLALAFSLGALALSATGLASYVLASYRRELREAGLRVSFVNQVSHELKSPLTNIRLYAELLETQLAPGEDKAREYALVIQREGRRLGRLIHNVLSFGRRERAGAVDPVHPRAMVPDAGIEACLETFAISLAEKGLEARAELDCKEPRLVDPDVLDQILGNLVSNAEKYAASGGALLVSSSGTEGEIRVCVRDWGPGIPAGCEKKLFRAFERFHTRLTDGVGGTGLGLYLVRELARGHGGDARYENAHPGARFTVTLHAPLADGGIGSGAEIDDPVAREEAP